MLRVGVRALECLSVIHEHSGMPHGDIKPGNILVLEESPLEVTLTDFSLHGEDAAKGSEGFRAPEQAKPPHKAGEDRGRGVFE